MRLLCSILRKDLIRLRFCYTNHGVLVAAASVLPVSFFSDLNSVPHIQQKYSVSYFLVSSLLSPLSFISPTLVADWFTSACSCCVWTPWSPSLHLLFCFCASFFAHLFSNTPGVCPLTPLFSFWRLWDHHHCLRHHFHQGLHAHCLDMYKYSSWETYVIVLYIWFSYFFFPIFLSDLLHIQPVFTWC